MYERGKQTQHGKPHHVVKRETNRKPARDRRLGNLQTPIKVQKLQLALHAKGMVEKAILYIRDAFFAGRSFPDLADLNFKAREGQKYSG
jgi:hypothetical protein